MITIEELERAGLLSRRTEAVLEVNKTMERTDIPRHLVIADAVAKYNKPVEKSDKEKLEEALAHIASLEEIIRLTHIHSRKHVPGYCTVRQSDIDAMGRYFDSLDDIMESP